MFFFGKDTESTQYATLIDISSGSVGIGIIESTPRESLPKLLYAQRTEMRVSTHTKSDMHTDVERIKEVLLSSALTLANDGLRILREHNEKAKITSFFVTCSSPWAYTIARNVRYENDTSFKITKSIVYELIQSAEKEILSTIREHTHIQTHEFQIVEKATVDITVNDYSVINPFNLNGKMLSLSHIVGLVPTGILSSISEIQDKLFPHTHLRTHTFMLVAYCVLRDLFPKSRSMCIIDITGEATEFGIVENNLLVENSFIQQGCNTLLRDVSKSSGKPVSDIRTSLYEAEKHNTLDSKIYEPFSGSYTESVQTQLTTILAQRSLPEHIILITNPPFAYYFKTLLEKVISEVIHSEVLITTLDNDTIQSLSETNNSYDTDVYLSLSARFFHKVNGCAEIDIID